jgi:hypothetical protein
MVVSFEMSDRLGDRRPRHVPTRGDELGDSDEERQSAPEDVADPLGLSPVGAGVRLPRRLCPRLDQR